MKILSIDSTDQKLTSSAIHWCLAAQAALRRQLWLDKFHISTILIV